MSSSRGDLEIATPMYEGDRQIAQGGHHLWRIAGTQTRAVLPKGDVTDIMQRVLNTPVAAHEREQARRRSEHGGKGGDQIDDLLGGLVGATHGDGAGELGHLGDVGLGDREVPVERGADLDTAHLHAPSLILRRAGLIEVCLGVSEIGFQIVIQGGLIGFDGQHSVSLPGVDQGHKVHLGMHGIGGVDPSGHRQTRQHLLGDGDFVRFLVDAHVAARIS